MNPAVSKVHGKEKRWGAEFAALRKLCLGSGLNEELKGALLKDPKGILVQQTKNVQAARQIRFGSVADIDRQKTALTAYIRAAIAVEKSGARVVMKTAAQFDVPPEFQERLDHDPKLAEAFRALTPGRQKGYLLHFAGAKRSATRAARVEKHAPRIMQGLGLDDRGTRADSKELE